MFKRMAAFLTAMFIVSLAALTLFWQDASGMELYSNVPLTKADRMSQDLGGKWDSFLSLREASAQENRLLQSTGQGGLTGLSQVNSIVLPSNRGFKVAAKRFRVTGKWGFKTPLLMIDGLYGKVRIFLNGIDEANFLGEIEGIGGNHSIEISPVRLDFSKENIVYLELAPAGIGKQKLFGWLWPEQGRITGQIRLEAVSETTIDPAGISLAYNHSRQQLSVGVRLRHHQSLEHGPWALRGVIKDEGKKAAECLVPLNASGEYEQQVDLVFNVPDAKLWSMDSPSLYELELILTNNRGDYDRIQLPIGVRDYSGSNGEWLLNSERIVVKGEILTPEQDFSIRNKRKIEEYLRDSKARGTNMLYFMGFFPDEEWLYTADRLGIGTWLELPVNLAPQGKIPPLSELEELILIAEHHPSVLAWTAAKGLEPCLEAQEYLRQARARLDYLPVYNISLPGQDFKMDSLGITLAGNVLEGKWGKAEYLPQNTASSYTPRMDGFWAKEKYAAVCWLGLLLLINFQNLRSSGWDYKDLFHSSPRRKLRRACFWSCLGFVSRLATLGGILTSLLFRLPVNLGYWLPYDTSLLLVLQSQNPFLIWLFLSFSFLMLRMLQVGLAVSSFPQCPGTLDLCCWLERRSYWVILVGLAWPALSYGLPCYVPLTLFFLGTIVFLPFRVRDVRQTGGKYSHLLFLPLTALAVGLGTVLWHYEDLFYLIKLVQPSLDFNWTQILN